ncbi:MAG: GNAT family N-acetyltransferase, partial [Mycobacteriales bacterium]
RGPVGTGRLLVRGTVGRVGRLAVTEGARGTGIGAALLSALEQEAIGAGLASIELHAQLPARGFYERAGYAAVGPVFAEAGLDHVAMRKALPLIRAVADSDSAALIALIGDCWAAYPGTVMDVDGEEPWLRAPATAYSTWRGQMWVVTLDGAVVACAGIKPREDHAELKSLYVAAAARRRGLGERLTGLVEDAARRSGLRQMRLWSDTRFTDAHRLYDRLGYARLPMVRELHDLSNSVEYGYQKDL